VERPGVGKGNAVFTVWVIHPLQDFTDHRNERVDDGMSEIVGVGYFDDPSFGTAPGFNANIPVHRRRFFITPAL
jgi:hypothetical protein